LATADFMNQKFKEQKACHSRYTQKTSCYFSLSFNRYCQKHSGILFLNHFQKNIEFCCQQLEGFIEKG